MFARYFYGGYNATTSILLAVVFNVCLYLLLHLAGMILMPFLSIAALIGFPLVAWGLAAAAQGPNTSGIGSFMCWCFAILQFGFCALSVIGLFL